MVKKHKNPGEFEDNQNKHNLSVHSKIKKNTIICFKPIIENEKEPVLTDNNKDYVWWLI